MEFLIAIISFLGNFGVTEEVKPIDVADIPVIESHYEIQPIKIKKVTIEKVLDKYDKETPIESEWRPVVSDVEIVYGNPDEIRYELH